MNEKIENLETQEQNKGRKDDTIHGTQQHETGTVNIKMGGITETLK